VKYPTLVLIFTLLMLLIVQTYHLRLVSKLVHSLIWLDVDMPLFDFMIIFLFFFPSLKSVRLPMLTILKLHSCEGITSASMSAIAHSSLLEVWILLLCMLVLPRCVPSEITLEHCYCNFYRFWSLTIAVF
jgi:hypothetical protein